jgi:peptidylprolyl isomerase
LDSLVRRLAAVLLAASLTLVACGGSDDGGDPDPTATATESQAAIVDGPLPEVTGGGFGTKPTVATLADPGGDLAVKVLSEGTGPEVQEKDLLVAHYLGQIADTGTVFDNSYDRNEPSAFAIGADKVIKGWDEALVGQKVGSRVELAIPPTLGYGEQGRPEAGIEGDDTLVFVVDIVNAFPVGASAPSTPVASLPAELPTVAGEPGEAPEVTIEDGDPAPTATAATVVAEGTGEPLAVDRNLVGQVVQVSYASKETDFSSWDDSPLSFKAADLPGLAEAITGKNAGTRVLMQVSAADSGSDPLALVIDVVASY